MRIFAERLKAARLNKGLGSVELGALLSVGNSSVSRWEAGVREPSLDTIANIAEILGVSVSYLIGGSDEPTPKTGTQNVGNVARIFEEGSLIEIPLLNVATVASSLADCLYSAIPEGVKTIHVEKVSFEMLDSERMPFALTMENDSMAGADIENGDIMIISPADTVKSGDVAFACHGDMWLIRWIYLKPDGSIELHASNPNYTPIIVEKEHAEDKRWFRLIGKVIEIRHKPKTGI